MENQRNQFGILFDNASDYLETRLDLFKLKSTQKASEVISSLASRLILILIVSLVVFMINIGLALLIGELMGKSYYGFFVLAVFYSLVGFVFHQYKTKWVEDPVADSIIKKMIK